MKKYKYRVKPWMLPVGLTLIFVLILRFVLLVGYVPTPSMEPTKSILMRSPFAMALSYS